MILVTGGGGYIGAVTVRHLLRAGYRVRVVDKFLFGTDVLGDVSNQIEIVRSDIRKLDRSVFEGVTAVLHLAGLSNDPTAEFNPTANREINTGGTEYVARLAKQSGVRRLIFASSCAIYDRGLSGNPDLLSEEAPVSPKAAYAQSKLAAEEALLSLADERFQPIILRQGTVYGWSPRMRYDLVVNTFVKTAYQRGSLILFCRGEMWRPLVDVNDTARCYLTCLEADLNKVGGQIFNVSYRNYRIRDLAHEVKDALAGFVPVDIEFDDTPQIVRDYRVSTEKTERILGFHPKVSIAEAVHDIASRIQRGITADFDNPKYYNIRWMELLHAAEEIVRNTGSIF